jgi:outer membrane PBP1 activator LpoA protein
MTFNAQSKTGPHFGLYSLRPQWCPQTLIFGILLLLLGGCTTLPTSLEPEVVVEEAEPEAPEAVIEEPEVITHAIEEGDQIVAIDDPWDLVKQAETAPESEAPGLLIRAISEFINQGQYFTAQSLADRLNDNWLTPEENLSFQVIHAQLATAAGKHQQAIEMLSALNPRQIENIPLRKQAFEALAISQIASGRLTDAAITLLELDTVVTDSEQLDNQRRILSLLQTMDGLHISLLKEYSSSPSLEGWLALTDTLKTTTPALLQADIQNWRLAYPGHPAQLQLLSQFAGQYELDEYRQIGLLLPLTSPYGTAARAFYDGFMEAHSNNFTFQPPRIVLYDTGEESFLSSFYYQAAVNEGSDFIVGPLGREAAEQLLSAQPPEVPTLLIAEIPDDKTGQNLFGISLSPEKEAVQAANRAFADGHRQVSIFRSDSDWGTRVSNAFISQWELLGGKVVNNNSFPGDVSDYSRIIQRFLGLDKSNARKIVLESQVGTKLSFTPRRNDDMDFLFLAANAAQARLVVPQLRFFQAHDLPMYATSYVYSGKPDPAVDADLDGVIFGDMKWMFEAVTQFKAEIAEQEALKAAQEAAEAEADTSETVNEEGEAELVQEETENESSQDDPVAIITVADASDSGLDELDDLDDLADSGADEATDLNRNPYKDSALNRLYALGLESYNLIPRLNGLANNPWNRFYGKTMTVSVDENGGINRIPVWARFISGLPEPIDPIDVAAPVLQVPLP